MTLLIFVCGVISMCTAGLAGMWFALLVLSAGKQ